MSGKCYIEPIVECYSYKAERGYAASAESVDAKTAKQTPIAPAKVDVEKTDFSEFSNSIYALEKISSKEVRAIEVFDRVADALPDNPLKQVRESLKGAKRCYESAQSPRGNIAKAKKLLEDLLPQSKNELRICTFLGLGVCYRLQGNAVKETEMYEEVKEVALSTGEKVKGAIGDKAVNTAASLSVQILAALFGVSVNPGVYLRYRYSETYQKDLPSNKRKNSFGHIKNLAYCAIGIIQK